MSKTFKRIASIALPVAASFIPGLGPLGAAAVGGLGGAIGGGGIKGALLGALGGGLGAGVLGGAPGASGIGLIDKLNTGLYSAMSPLRSIASSVGNSMSSGFNDIFGTSANAAGNAVSGATSQAAPVVGATVKDIAPFSAADQAFLQKATANVGSSAAPTASQGILSTIKDKILNPSITDIAALGNIVSSLGSQQPEGMLTQEQILAQMQADKAAEQAKTEKFIAGLNSAPLQRNQTNPQIDYYSYGSRPEERFFDQIGTTPVSQLAKGGRATSPLQGLGGQDDTVPAKLSVGEYVIPADIVASLGDGNNDAGAKALDQLLKNVRKHKAPAMKKGSLPPKAKSPLAYLGKAA